MVYTQLKKVKVVVDKKLNPYTRLLAYLGVKPNHLTALTLPTGILGIHMLFINPYLGFFLVLLYFTFDFSDGMLARHLKCETKLGEQLDYNIDRIIALFFLYKLYIIKGQVLLPLFAGMVIGLLTFDDILEYFKTKKRKT